MKSRLPLRKTLRFGFGLGVAMTAAVLASCASTSSLGVQQKAPESALPTKVVSDVPSAVSDAASCEAFGDVATILQNAAAGLREGRMQEQEYNGWMRLATRVLDRVPTTGAGDVSDSISTLKSLSPAIPSGSTAETEIGSDEWLSAVPLAQACNAVGSPIPVQMFTGG